MSDPQELIDQVGEIVEQMARLGLRPVLVGGMALVVLGSRRVTRDFDFVISTPRERLEPLVAMLYDRGLELAARVSEGGDVTATIDNRRVACSRLTIDQPPSAFFLDRATGLRIDLLFDFPVAASELASRARRLKIRTRVFQVASIEDLMHLKEIASKTRSAPGDTEDLAYLRRQLRAK